MKVPEETGVQLDESRRRPRRFVPYVLVVYLILLVALVVWSAATDTTWEFAAWDSQNALVRWAGQLMSIAFRDLVLFFPLGFLVAGSLRWSDRDRGCLGLLFAVSAGLVVSLALATAARVGFTGLPIHRLSFQVLVFLTFCCSCGSWAGATWRRTHGVIGWLLFQTVLLVVSLAAIAGG